MRPNLSITPVTPPHGNDAMGAYVAIARPVYSEFIQVYSKLEGIWNLKFLFMSVFMSELMSDWRFDINSKERAMRSCGQSTENYSTSIEIDEINRFSVGFAICFVLCAIRLCGQSIENHATSIEIDEIESVLIRLATEQLCGSWCGVSRPSPQQQQQKINETMGGCGVASL